MGVKTGSCYGFLGKFLLYSGYLYLEIQAKSSCNALFNGQMGGWLSLQKYSIQKTLSPNLSPALALSIPYECAFRFVQICRVFSQNFTMFIWAWGGSNSIFDYLCKKCLLKWIQPLIFKNKKSNIHSSKNTLSVFYRVY